VDFLKDFLALNQFRHQLMRPSSIEWEQHQQIMEGLADYSAYRLLQIANMPWPETPAEALSGEIQSSIDYAIQRRHYSVGAALAMTLDILKVNNWREVTEKRGVSQQEQLTKLFSLTPQEIVERVEMARISYQYQPIHQIVAKEVETYVQEVYR